MMKSTTLFLLFAILIVSPAHAMDMCTYTGIEIVNQTQHPISFQLGGAYTANGHVPPGKTVTLQDRPTAVLNGENQYKYELSLAYAYTRGAKCELVLKNGMPIGATHPEVLEVTGEVLSVDVPWWDVRLQKRIINEDRVGGFTIIVRQK